MIGGCERKRLKQKQLMYLSNFGRYFGSRIGVVKIHLQARVRQISSEKLESGTVIGGNFERWGKFERRSTFPFNDLYYQ